MIATRKAEIKDLGSLVILFDQYRIWYGKESDLEKGHKFLADRMRSKESIVYVALEGDEMVGFVQCYFQFSSVGLSKFIVLNDLFVSGSHRNLGIGKMLIEEVKKFCIASSYTGIQLETEKSNDTGNQLYPKVGFELINHNFYFMNNSK